MTERGLRVDHSTIGILTHFYLRESPFSGGGISEGEADSSERQTWEADIMSSIDKKLEKEVKEGKIPKAIEDLPSEWAPRRTGNRLASATPHI
jgi:hypothetical protein